MRYNDYGWTKEQENYLRKLLKKGFTHCSLCKDNKNLVVHYVDGDRNNDYFNNLTVLCKTCHGKVHFGTLKKYNTCGCCNKKIKPKEAIILCGDCYEM